MIVKKGLILSLIFAILCAFIIATLFVKNFYDQYSNSIHSMERSIDGEVEVCCKILINSTCGGKLIMVLKATRPLHISFIEVHFFEGQKILSKDLELKLDPGEYREVVFLVNSFNSKTVNSLLASNEVMVRIIFVLSNGMMLEKNIKATVSLEHGCKSCPILGNK